MQSITRVYCQTLRNIAFFLSRLESLREFRDSSVLDKSTVFRLTESFRDKLQIIRSLPVTEVLVLNLLDNIRESFVTISTKVS
jgi:hypothetical protein